MVGRIVDTGLRQHLAALRTVLLKFVEHTSAREVLFDCLQDLHWMECIIWFVEGSVALFNPYNASTWYGWFHSYPYPDAFYVPIWSSGSQQNSHPPWLDVVTRYRLSSRNGAVLNGVDYMRRRTKYLYVGTEMLNVFRDERIFLLGFRAEYG